MKLRNLDLTANPINAEHAELGLPPIEEAVSHPGEHPLLRVFAWLAAFMLISAVAYLMLRLFNFSGSLASAEAIVLNTLQSKVFWSAVAVGMLAQTIDGALGMAYGITSNTFLLAS